MATKRTPRPRKKANGRPRGKTYGQTSMRFRLYPGTLWALRTLAALLKMGDSDLADEALQVGLGYIYARRRANLARPFAPIPEIWQQLDPAIPELKTLSGTEFPPA